MNAFRKTLLFSFVVLTLAAIVAAFWFFSREPSPELIQKAFPEDSYKLYANSKSITLYSLEPRRSSTAGKEDFHGYPILVKGEIKDEKFVYLLKRSLKNALSSKDGAKCFNPRHGVRIVDGDKVLDMVICFECENMETHYNGKQGFTGLGTEGLGAETLFNSALSGSHNNAH